MCWGTFEGREDDMGDVEDLGLGLNSGALTCKDVDVKIEADTSFFLSPPAVTSSPPVNDDENVKDLAFVMRGG